MSVPSPITPPEFVRRQSVGDLELTLVKFLQRLFDSYRLDNPTLNLAQPAVVPFDPVERAQALTLKVMPRILRGQVPRTVTGEISADKLPDCPAIIVQCVSAKVEQQETFATVRILASAYDENPDGSGYQDVQNMIEAMVIALTTFGQGAIDRAYPIVLPIEWKLVEADAFPHYIGEMTTQWELPSGRPLPDADMFGIIPGEHLELRREEALIE